MRTRPRVWRVGTLVRLLAATALIGAWTLVAPAHPAGASSLDGCSGTAESLDANGKVIDQAVAAGGQVTDPADGSATFTAAHPFVVRNDGIVNYSGRSDAVITNHSWKITMLGVTIASGGSQNSGRVQQDSGQFDVADRLGFGSSFTGLVRVSGDITGTGGSCTGDGYVKVEGNPMTSPITWGGLVFASLGALGIFLSLPRVAPPKGA